MTNGEKYKTAKERVDAFYEHCKKECRTVSAGYAFHWLDLEAEAEDPLPCPFCGSRCEVKLGCVECTNNGCCYTSGNGPNDESAVAAHNRVARAAKAKEAK